MRSKPSAAAASRRRRELVPVSYDDTVDSEMASTLREEATRLSAYRGATEKATDFGNVRSGSSTTARRKRR